VPVPVRTADEKRVFVTIANSLASHYITKAHHAKEHKQRDDLFRAANILFNKADRQDPRFPLTELGKAILHFYRGDFSKARTNINIYLDKVTDSKVGRVVAALLSYQEKKPEAALETLSAVLTDRYGEVLTAGGSLDQAVVETSRGVYSSLRPALAHLWASLRQPERAGLALKRQRTLTPNHEGASVALGILLLNQYNAELAKYNADVATGKQATAPNPTWQANGLTLISQVYTANNAHALANNVLSHYALLTKTDEDSLQKALALAGRAFGTFRFLIYFPPHNRVSLSSPR
jgi:hypothetical protein